MSQQLVDLKNAAALKGEECKAVLDAIRIFAGRTTTAVIRGSYDPDDYLKIQSMGRVLELLINQLCTADNAVDEYEAEEDFRRRQQAAHSAVAAAVVSGALVRSSHCERCPTVAENTVAHHHDYDKPLDVEWLCRPCHGKHHAENGSAL